MLGLSVYNVFSHTTNSLLTPNPMKFIAHTNTQSHTQYISIVIKEYYNVCVWPYTFNIASQFVIQSWSVTARTVVKVTASVFNIIYHLMKQVISAD